MTHRYSLLARTLFIGVAAFLAGLAPVAEAQTQHDTPPQALPIFADGAFTFSATDALVEDGGFYPQLNMASSCSGANDGRNTVFTYIRPTVNTSLTADLLGSSFDTILSVWTLDGTEIACNDDSGRQNDLTSRVESIPLTAGTTYFIRVTGYRGASGDVTLTVGTGGNLVHPSTVVGNSGAIIPLGNLLYFNWNFNTPVLSPSVEARASCSPGDSGHSVWYAINLTGPLTLDIETVESTFDPIISVYGANLSEIACDDDGGAGVNAKLTVNLPQGQSYIRISGHSNSPEGQFFLNVNRGTTVATEEAVDATVVYLNTVFPNPVAEQATIAYQLVDAGSVRLAVYDVLGREVALLVDREARTAGDHTASFDASDLPSGLYVVRLVADGVTASTSITVAR